MNITDIWTLKESAILEKVSKHLASRKMSKESSQFRKTVTAIEHQTKAFSLYPSILQSNQMGDSKRDIESLIAILSKRYRDEDIFVMPTKATLGRSIEVGKINLLYMANHLACASKPGIRIQKEVYGSIMNRLLSLMVEDVLLEILSEPIENNIKEGAAKKLADIWENRISTDKVFIPELRKMWLIRRESIPVFGTLLGTHEYISLYKNTEQTCRSYILHASSFANEAAALEEFLFGLSYEELRIVKKRLADSTKGCIRREEITDILKKESIYLSSEIEDPMELYRFFNHRRKQAVSRWYTKSRGPRRTFEEYFMAYILSTKLVAGEKENAQPDSLI